MNNTRQIKTFIGAMILATASTVAYTASVSHSQHGYFALAVLVLAAASSKLKVKLPGIDGNMSVNLPFLLTAVVNLSAVEAVLVTAVSTAVQCWPKKPAKFNAQQMAFNLSTTVFASALAWLAFHVSVSVTASTTMGFALATATLFLGQTVPVAGIISVSEKKSAAPIWWNLAHLSFPYFVLSAGVTSMVQAMSSHLGWGLALAVFPVMFAIHRSYRMYFGQAMDALQPQTLVRAAGAGA